MKFVFLFLFLMLCSSVCVGQSGYSLYLNGGLSYLFEASTANEAPGSFVGIGLQKSLGRRFSLFASYEQISCQNDAINGVSEFRPQGGEWMISHYQGYINLQRRAWAFMDIQVDERLFSAGTWNYPGNQQTFDAKNFIVGAGYILLNKNKFMISARVGVAVSRTHVQASNLGYGTKYNDKGYWLNVRAFFDYLYVSPYIAVPVEYKITKKSSVGIIGSLYKADDLYLPSYGIILKSDL